MTKQDETLTKEMWKMPKENVAHHARLIGSNCGYRVDKVFQAVLYLLTDVNARDAAEKITKIFVEDLKAFGSGSNKSMK